MAIHFISDLHLNEDQPWLGELFAHCLHDWVGRIDALYILGDLFEYWVGDDDDNGFHQQMLQLMQVFSRQTPLYVMHGNRDFLLGKAFEQLSGAHLLPAQHQLSAYGHDYLLLHGDELCTDDLPYQQFRQMVRQSAWQQAFLAKPLAERHAIARQIRQQSEARKQADGPSEISDVSPEAVLQTLAAHPDCTLIHGHTHRPACHDYQLAGQTRQRWVIRDWHDGQGGYLRLDAQGLSAHLLSL